MNFPLGGKRAFFGRELGNLVPEELEPRIYFIALKLIYFIALKSMCHHESGGHSGTKDITMMNKLNLAITTDENGVATVHLNASFESKAEGVDFHADVAALCRKASLLKLKPTNGETYLPMLPRGWPKLGIKSLART